MKKKLSFLMALVAMWLCTGSVWAQEITVESPWKGVAIENGSTYYLYNPAAKAFLKAGNSWGTRASFGEDAIAFVAVGDSNMYALSSTSSYAGKYLGENLFVDSPRADYVFEEVADGIYTFNLNGAYYAYTGLNTVETITEVTDGCYWQLLTADAIKEQMQGADTSNPYNVTALISGANFNRNNQANSVWIGSPATGGDNPNYCAEKWGAGAFDVNQTLTGLPNGTYLLQAQGFYRVGGGANDATLAVEQYAAGDPALNAILYGNDAEMPLMSIMAEAKAGDAPNGNYFSTSLGYVPQNMTGASLFFSEGLYEHAMYVTVTDGTLKMGVKKSVELANDWVIFDNFRLTYYGNASVGEIEASKLQDYIDEVVALIAAAQEVETIYSEGAKTELDVAVAVGEAAIAAPTKEGLVAAVAPLEAAIARAERSVAINGVAGSATLTAPVAFTQFVTNPDMADGTINGWTAASGWQFQSNTVYTGEGAELNKFQERWNAGTGLGNTSTMQALKDMPNGIYRVSADVMATAQYDADPEGYTTGAYWVANQDSVAVATANEKPERVSVDVMVTDGVLNIGLVGVNTTANWMGLDNVTVIYYGAEGSLEDIDKQEYIDAFNVQCVELASLADTCGTIHLIPAVSERFFAVQEPAFAIYESVSVAPVDTLIYYTVLLQETTAYVKAMDAKYNEWKTVLLSCYDAQDSITTASPEATAAFAEVVDRHAAYQWSMPAATTAEMDTLIAELNDALEAFLIAAETPSSEDTSVAIDKTDKVGTSKEAWNTTGGPVTIDGISMPEVYETTTATLGDVMWQTVEGLDNGVYTVELWANARYTPERGFESAATDGQLECTYLFANNVEISIPVVYNRNLTNNVSYVLDGVEVIDGTLRMGMTKKADGSNWHTIQIKSLTLHTSGEAALAAAQAKLQTVLDTAVTVPATEALTAAIVAAQTVLDTSTDIDELNAAVVTLKTAIAIAVNTNAVAGATVGSPIVTNFVVNGTFDTDGVVAPWKTTTGAMNQTTATNQTGAFTGNFFENWNGSNFTGKIYQVIENIPNGLYELSICAFVATLGDSAQYVYANADRTVLTTGEPTAYTVRTTVTNNTLEIGLEQAAAVNGWMGIDNVSLTYFGEVSDVDFFGNGLLSSIPEGNHYVFYTDTLGNHHFLHAEGINNWVVGNYPNLITFSAGNITGGYARAASFMNSNGYYMSNAQNSDGSGAIKTEAIDGINGLNKRLWESQVFYKNAAGKYAIRLTNATGTGWGANCFVNFDPTTLTVASGQPTLGDALYLWEIADEDDPRFSTQVLDGLIEEAEAIDGKLHRDIKMKLDSVIVMAKLATAIEVQDVKVQLEKAIAAAKASVAEYEAIAHQLASSTSLLVETAEGYDDFLAVVTAAEDAYNDATATNDMLLALVDATATYLAANEVKGAIVNGTFGDAVASLIGWTGAMDTGYHNKWTNVNGGFVEKWAPVSMGLEDFDFYQELTGLPAGTYTFTAYVGACLQNEPDTFEVKGVKLYANSDSVEVHTINIDRNAENHAKGPERIIVTATIADGDLLRVGLSVRNTDANWVVMDNAKLYCFDASVSDTLITPGPGETPEGVWTDITAERLVNGDMSSEEGWALVNVTDHEAETYRFLGFYSGWDALEVTSSSVKQEVSLPAGQYRLTGSAFYRAGVKYNVDPAKSLGYMVAGDNKVLVKTLGSVEGLNSYADNIVGAYNAFYLDSLYTNVLEFTLDVDTVLSIGYECEFDEIRSWMGIGAMKLEKLYTVKDRFIEVKDEYDMLAGNCMSLYSLSGVNARYMEISDRSWALISNIDSVSTEEMEALIPVMVEMIAEVKEIEAYFNDVFTPVKFACYDIQDNSIAKTQEIAAAFEEVVSLTYNMGAVENLEDLQMLVDALEMARRQYVVNAVPTNGFTFDYTFLVEGVGNSAYGWTRDFSGGNFQYMNSSNKNTETLKKTGYVEAWNSTSYAGTISYTATGIPNGYYTVSAYAFTNGITSFFANNGVAMVDSTTMYVKPVVDSVLVTDGTMAFGLNIESASWVGLTNIELAFVDAVSADLLYGAKREAFIERYTAMEIFSQESLNYSWNGINNNYFWPVMDEALAIRDTIDFVTDIALLDSMKFAMDNAEATVLEAYAVGERYNNIRNLFWDAADHSTPVNDEVRMAMETALENSNYASYMIATVWELEKAAADIKAAYLAYVTNAVPNEGFKFDVTFMINNPSFESGTLSGWRTIMANDTGVKPNADATYTMENCDGNYLFNTWYGTGLYLKQNIQGLPVGVYELGVVLASDAGVLLDVTVGDAVAYQHVCESGKTIGDEVIVKFVHEGGALPIGVSTVNNDWFKADNFRLYSLGASTPEPEKILGDVNGDMQLTMSDVVMQVNAVLNIVQDNYDEEVADMNGDGQITIVDVVSVLRLVLGYESMASARSMDREAAVVAIEAGSAMAGSNGEIILPVYMNSEAVYTAFQMDVVLPEGMSLTNATLGARAKSSHSIAWSTLDNGIIRVVAFAMDNATFNDNAEALAYLTLKVEAAVADDAVLTLTEGLFATMNGAEDRADDVAWRTGDETTSINSMGTACRIYGTEGAVVVESTTDTTISVYTATGQLASQADVKTGKNSIVLPAGIYVVNNQKVIVK